MSKQFIIDKPTKSDIKKALESEQAKPKPDLQKVENLTMLLAAMETNHLIFC
jgi:hypothetical protein